MRRFISTILLLLALVSMVMPAAIVAQTLIIRIAPPALPVTNSLRSLHTATSGRPGIGLMVRRVFLGPWNLGATAFCWPALDAGLLGMARRRLWLNAGYWGPHIGFYGGVNYGFGYGGVGYEGGRWNNGVFAYNRTVNNFGSISITNVYNQTVISNTSVTRVSFNGGTGGTAAQPTPQEQAAARETHVAATPTQTQHEQTASTNKTLLASVNHGSPAVAATSKPGEFSGKGIVPAKAVQPSATVPKTSPAAATLEKKGSTVGASATNAGQPPKPINNQAKPLAAVSPPKAVAPKPPPSRPVAASRPAKPSGPPPKQKPQ